MLWDELHVTPDLPPGDRQAGPAPDPQAQRPRLLGRRDRDRAVGSGGNVRLRLTVARRAFHARELRRLTGIVALENQARLLLNDLREYGAWLQWAERRSIDSAEVAERWRTEVYEPAIARIAQVVGPDRDIVQAYCDLLEHKWLLSERAGRDVGMQAAMESYLALGAPAPEVAGSDSAGSDAAGSDVADVLGASDATAAGAAAAETTG